MLKKLSSFGLLVVLLMSLSLVFAACGDNPTPTPGTTASPTPTQAVNGINVPVGLTSPLSTAFPPTTQLYVTLNTDSSSDQIASWQKIVAYLDNIPELKQVFDQADVFKLAGLGSYDTDVKPWIGKELAIGVTDIKPLLDLTSGSSSSQAGILQNPPFMVAVAVKDKAGADAFIKKLISTAGALTGAGGAAPATSDYKGATLYHVPAGPVQITVALNDKMALITGSDAIAQQALDRAAGAGLDGSAKFKKVTSQLPSGNLSFIYLDAQTVFSDLYSSTLFKQALSQSGSSNNNLLTNQYTDGLGLTIGTTPEGFLVYGYDTLLADKETGDAKTMLSRSPNKNTILGAMPSSTIGFFNGQDLSTTYDLIMNSITSAGTQGKQVTDAISNFEQQTGLSVKNDIVSLFKGEFALFVNSQSMTDHPKDLPVGIGLMTAVSDKTAAQASLDKITAALEKGSNGQIKFDSATSGSTTYKAAALANTSSSYLSMGIAGNYVFLSLDNQKAAPVITSATGGDNFTKGANYATFTKTQSNLVGNNQGYFYLDIQQTFKTVEAALPADQQGMAKPILDKLGQLMALGSATSQTTADGKTSVFIYFPVTK